MSQEPPRWTLERKVPLWAVFALIITCLSAGVGAAASAAVLAQRVTTLEERSRMAAEDHDLLISMQADLKTLQAVILRIENRQIKESRE